MEKNKIKLAIFGARAVFKKPLHVGLPNIGNKKGFLKRTAQILDSRWLTNRGRFVQEFEKQVKKILKVKHCIAMCNATVALEIAIRALEMKGEVIVPSMTFVATAHALQWQEITPVFCDINPNTLCIDPGDIEGLITPRTTGIIGVHVFGVPCDVRRIRKIAKKYKLRLLFDAAHAFNCSYEGRMIGNFGDAEVFSFHATKFLNTFEGGVVTTNSQVLAEKIRLMQNFGFAGVDNVIYLGTNGKMSEISAAMGISSLENMQKIIKINRQNFFLYKKYLSNIPGVILRNSYDEDELYNYQYIVVQIDHTLSGLTRDDILQVLFRENVLARRYFFPGCHNMAPYRSYYPNAKLLLPNTEKLNTELLQLPTGTGVHGAMIQKICKIIKVAVKNNNEVRKQVNRLSNLHRKMTSAVSVKL